MLLVIRNCSFGKSSHRPNMSEQRLKSVIGDNDSRRVQLATRESPWAHVCSLEVAIANRVYCGTGWLANPITVVTAAHCLASISRFGGRVDRATVTPGAAFENAPFGALVSSEFRFHPSWQGDDFESEADLGAIILQPPGFAHAAIAPLNLADVTSSGIVVAGYPTYGGTNRVQLVGAGEVKEVVGGLARHDVDTGPGQSGSPLLRRAPGGAYDAVGVHVRQAGPHEELNVALAFSEQVIGLVCNWMGL